jgi:pyrroline-5-carboxylate reductase
MTEATKTTTIGFLGGGNMAEAILRGLLAKGVSKPEQLRVAEPREARRTELAQAFGIVAVPSNRDVAAFADVVVLATKPQILGSVLAEIEDALTPEKLVISIAAGVSLATLEAALPKDCRVVRTMPNTPALVSEGATAIAPGRCATEGDLRGVTALFSAVGEAVVIGEASMDAVTGLSGSGPAYVFQFIEALADGGVRAGLPRDVALRLAAQTVRGAATLLLETGQHPGVLKDMVTSPGGTTIAGVHALERGGLRGTVMNAVEAATERSAELGRGAK